MQIGQVAQEANVTTKTLRFWEGEGLLPAPARSPNGYRDYPPDTVTRAGFVRRAQASGLTLRQIGEILAIRDEGVAPCEHVARVIDDRMADVQARLAHLVEMRDALLEVQERLVGLDPADCAPDKVCAAIQP